ncbi:response regulator transcription factor [Rossellomorea sp. YZS02]|uniref:response regulator transcription factor n=1 Tax=Rossellomorea sp. YZS02 TaxID=3097358 RepID=UPI002A12517C|nr:response regulator transcription factor [Rossellomorea sp. YZS02]MDX8342351.1 response regulator transcription factor [Rossellomorea sp. YZS02]
MNEPRLLIVDDESALIHMLETILKKEGFKHIDTSHSAEGALDLCKKNTYDLLLLDVMLPNRSGFDICPLLREYTDAAIIFLTARSSDLDKLSGFALGADDYITKPFNPLEVVARVKVHLRRQNATPPSSDQNTYRCGPIVINTGSGEVSVNGKRADLPAQVYQLLLFFCKHPNQLFSKGQLYENVWGSDYLGEENTVMVHIRKLREKIESNPSNPKHLVTVRGLGYKLLSNGDSHEHS